MKLKFCILSVFVCLLLNIQAQKHTTTYTLQWNGIENWYADSTYQQVIALQDAVYPTLDFIPHISHTFSANVYNTSVQVSNVVLTAVTPQELALISNIVIPQEIQIQSRVITERGHDELSVLILPFIEENGIVKKIVQYNLEVEQSNNPIQKITHSLHTYADNSVLASGNFYKIRISESGIYRLTSSDLATMGVTVDNVRIFGYGGAMLEQSFNIANTDDLPEIAIYRGSDYVLFYAQGPVSWSYSANNRYFAHKTNTYSDYGYYFVSADKGIGKRITTASAPETIKDTTIVTFVDYQLHEQDLRNLIDVDKGSGGGGREFYGEVFNSTLEYNFTFGFPNILSTPSYSNHNYNKVKLDVAASAGSSSSFYLLLNSTRLQTITLSAVTDNYTKATTGNATSIYTPTNNNLNFVVQYNKTASTGKGYLNYLEVNAERELKMTGNVLFFRNPNAIGRVHAQYQLANATPNIQVWNITDVSNIYAVKTTLNNGVLQFGSENATLQEFVAVNLANVSTLPRPVIVGSVANQNLHNLNNIEYVIITHPDFISQAQTLAQAHRDLNNLTVAVVTTEQVYNEFSSGTPDATAYRWLMKMLYDRANANSSLLAPRYLLLFGDGTFDNRKKLLSSGENKILTYQAVNSVTETRAYPTDDYFGFLDNNEGLSDVSDRVDIGIGRFCVTTTEQATNVVNKTIGYMRNETKGIWKNQLCFLGDDGDAGIHMTQTDVIASSVANAHKSFQVNKIYLDAYLQEITAAGESYPLAKNRLDNLLRNGTLHFHYNGHGGASEITNEGMLNQKEINALPNTNLGLWSLATCSFSKFDTGTSSGAEDALLNPSGGAIGVFSAARTVYATPNTTLLKHFTDNLYAKKNGEHIAIGDAVRLAKNKMGTDENKLSYLYIGDPAVKLNFPTEYSVVTESINGKSIEIPDTLRALSTSVIAGYVTDSKGVKADHFNGTIQIIVYDKEESVTTQNNDGKSGPITYLDRQSTIFSGKANVVDGDFSISFMLPKDIKYNYGTGRINYYVVDDTTGEDGQGFCEQFYIGGSNEEFEAEDIGPEVSIYLNSTAFAPGGKVNETPVFMAYLQDQNGINTSGAGIGHDLMLMIDNDPDQYYIVNEYFNTEEGDFRKGSVNYKLTELAEGKHTLTFKAWDLLNNSTTKTLEFEVVKGLDVAIYGVSSYPNPVVNGAIVNIKIDHDRPSTILETEVYIYDISGRLVQRIFTTSTDGIKWDLSQTSILPGIYLYKVNVKTEDSEFTTRTNKIIVLGH